MQRRSEWFLAMIDPPAATFALEPAPGSALGRDYGHALGERLGHGDTEILVERGQDKQFGATIGGPLLLTINRPLNRDPADAEFRCERQQLFVMGAFGRPDNTQLPIDVSRFNAGPSAEQPFESFLGVDASKRQHRPR